MATAEEIDAAVIQPMLATFPPPVHLRGRERAIEQALDVYRFALEGFPRPILEQAWRKAASENQYCMWPKCPDLVAAAKHYQRQVPQEEWVQRATDMADAYLNRFRHTQAAVKARTGGYQRELEEYVREAAWVQAQLIAGRTGGVGYSASVLFGGERMPEEWYRKAKEQAETGHIRVSVPREKIAAWAEKAKGRASSPSL